MRTCGFGAFVAPATLAAVTGILAACGAAPASQKDPDTLVILTMGDERALGPCWDISAQFLLSSPLAEEVDGELRGVLAKRWEHTPDYREWTIHLRGDVKWHDGAPFTAHDVKFTLDAKEEDRVAGGAPRSAEVTVLDDSTYVVRYDRIPHNHPISTWGVFYPRHRVEGQSWEDFRCSDFWLAPVGNGPYRYVRHVPKTLIELEANPDHFRGEPRIPRIILKFGSRERSGITELLSGEVDLITFADPAAVLRVRDDPRFRAYAGISPYWRRAIAWNQAHPPLRDARVRRALTMALDRRELHRLLDLPEGLPLTDAIYTERLFARGEIPPPLAYDPAGAARLLEEAGWRDTDGDGIREKDGVELRFTVPGEEPEAVWVQARLREVGAAMDIRPVERVLPLVNRGEFEAIIGDFGIGGRAGHQAYLGRESLIGYHNPRVAELLDSALVTLDPDALDAIYREIMPLVEADMPMTMLAPQVAFTIAHQRVRGLEDAMYPEAAIERLWLEGGQ